MIWALVSFGSYMYSLAASSSGSCEVLYAQTLLSILLASPSTFASSSGKATTKATVSTLFAIQITVENTWDVAPKDTDYKVGSQWWTDSYAPADYWHNCAGARNQLIVRDEIMEDWGQRWLWLRK